MAERHWEVLGKLNSAMDEFIERQEEERFQNLLKKSGLSVTPELDRPWIANTSEREKLFRAANIWLARLDLGKTKEGYDSHGDPRWVHTAPANSFGLYLCGGVGAGKTKLATVLALDVLETQCPIKITNSSVQERSIRRINGCC